MVFLPRNLLGCRANFPLPQNHTENQPIMGEVHQLHYRQLKHLPGFLAIFESVITRWYNPEIP